MKGRREGGAGRHGRRDEAAKWGESSGGKRGQGGQGGWDGEDVGTGGVRGREREDLHLGNELGVVGEQVSW